jgi:hypothetical protein
MNERTKLEPSFEHSKACKPSSSPMSRKAATPRNLRRTRSRADGLDTAIRPRVAGTDLAGFRNCGTAAARDKIEVISGPLLARHQRKLGRSET